VKPNTVTPYSIWMGLLRGRLPALELGGLYDHGVCERRHFRRTGFKTAYAPFGPKDIKRRGPASLSHRPPQGRHLRVRGPNSFLRAAVFQDSKWF